MSDKLTLLKDKMLHDLTGNILPFWMERAIDNKRGGWHGEISRSGEINFNAKRSLILNMRILWTFSAAYRVLKRPEYREMALRAYNYVTTYFLDPGGGAYYMINADGSPAERQKFTYAHGFALYAFAEYARADGR